MTEETAYRELLDAICDYVLAHDHPELDRFKPAMRDWGETYQSVEPAHQAVADYLPTAPAACDARGSTLLQVFVEHGRLLRWEQSYRKQDGLVPDAMLDGYGFAEIIGSRGPFVSDRIRAGIAGWGPEIDYPRHHHQAEEAYVLLGGSAEFHLQQAQPEIYRGGDVVYVSPNRRHGFRTKSERLWMCYLWQAGDLRQTSDFSG